MDCCVNNLGRFAHNKQIDTGLLMTPAGDYTLLMEASNGNTFELVKTLEDNSTIKFEVGDLNESMVYNFQIRKPDDSLYSYNQCDKFRLQTFINTQLDGCSNDCDDDDDTSPYYN